MNDTTKVEIKNPQGILISKEVPNDLLSQYINMGWKISCEKIEEKKIYIQPKKEVQKHTEK